MRADFEIWKPIKGYEGLYEVNNWGDVRNSKTKKVLSTAIVKRYYKTTLQHKMFTTHRLVAQAFLGLDYYDYTYDVHHKNHNTLDNYWQNLEVVDKHTHISEHSKLKVGKLNPNYGHKYSEEQRRNVSEALKGKYGGNKNPNYGHKWTNDMKVVQSQKLKGRHRVYRENGTYYMER